MASRENSTSIGALQHSQARLKVLKAERNAARHALEVERAVHQRERGVLTRLRHKWHARSDPNAHDHRRPCNHGRARSGLRGRCRGHSSRVIY